MFIRQEHGRASLRAIVMAMVAQTCLLGFVGWRVENVVVQSLAVAAIPQSHRVSHTKAITVTRLVGNERMVMDINPDTAFEVLAVRMHMSEETIAHENIIASVSCELGTEYSACLYEEDVHKIENVVWQPARPVMLCQKSGLHLEWANTKGIRYGIEVYWRSV